MDNPHRQLFLVAVHAFIIVENKLLMSERSNTGYMDGYWGVPAGHVDGQETIWQAMQREIKEETNLFYPRVQIPDHVMHRRNKNETEERIDFFFVFDSINGKLKNNEPEKCSKLEWQNISRLPTKTIPYIKEALSQIKNGNSFSEYN